MQVDLLKVDKQKMEPRKPLSKKVVCKKIHKCSEQLEKNLFYKFKNKENFIKFCDSKHSIYNNLPITAPTLKWGFCGLF
jgi:hypothetical protein